MSLMGLILIIVVLFLLFGGGFGYHRWYRQRGYDGRVGYRQYGGGVGIGIGGILLIVLVVWLLLGRGL